MTSSFEGGEAIKTLSENIARELRPSGFFVSLDWEK